MIPGPAILNRSPNQVAQALTGRPHVTYSEIKTYQNCPLKWHLQYVQKATPEQQSGAMLLGSCVHAALEAFYQAMLAAEPLPNIDQLMALYRDRWAQEAKDIPVQFAKEQDATTLEATARKMIETFLGGEFALPAGEIIGIEESFTVTLAPDLPDLAGWVDMITYSNGELVITDFKTARSIPTQEEADDQSEQLVLYAKGCEPIAKELGATIRLRFLYISKTKEPKIETLPVQIDDSRMERTKAVVRQVYRAMRNNVVYPAPSPMNCTGCPFGTRCREWHSAKGTCV